MDNLRRLRATSGNPRRPRLSLARLQRERLGKAEGRLAAALDQLRDGVPLNWLQMEGDPELVTLARLHPVAQEVRSLGLEALPPGFQESLADKLGKSLPPPKAKPAKAAPKSLAGFSENVPVLTQAQENVPELISRAPQWVAATVVAGLLVSALLMLVAGLFPTPRSGLRWIEVRQADQAALAPDLPSDYKAPLCPSWVMTDTAPYVIRNYVVRQDKTKAQADVDFPIEYLPETVGAGSVYTTSLLETAVAPCAGTGSVPFSSVRLDYLVRHVQPDGSLSLSALTLFEGRRQVVRLDADSGTWKRVTAGGEQGVLWRGDSYRDTSGNDWLEATNVLVVEHGEVTVTFVGRANKGITEQLLLALASEMGQALPAEGTPSPQAARPPAVTVQSRGVLGQSPIQALPFIPQAQGQVLK